MKPAKPIPFDFVLDSLFSLHPVTKFMFGATAVYVSDKIVLVLRENKKDTHANGIWVAVDEANHPALMQLIPSLTPFEIFGIKTRNWLLLPATSDHFEKEANQICALIKNRDRRIGRIPK